jgi:hypothetical protein
MKAAQVVEYHAPDRLVDVPEPVIIDPFDVLVRVAGTAIHAVKTARPVHLPG